MNTEKNAAKPAQHTPGPLRVERHGRGAMVVGEGHRVLADCRASCGSEIASCEANATLYAAAPDLLEALRACLPSLGEIGWSDHPFAFAYRDLRKQVANVVAKATGEAP